MSGRTVASGNKDAQLASARPLVREVPNSIPGDVTSLFQLLSALCSFNCFKYFKATRCGNMSRQHIAVTNCFVCTNKILLQRQRFSQKFSSTHEVICHCNVSSQCVAATCRLSCRHGVICRGDLSPNVF